MKETDIMYKLLDHEAEIGIEASADTIENAFCESSKALYSIMTEIGDITPNAFEEFEVKAENIAELLVECLNELVFLTSTKLLLFSNFEYKIYSENGKFIAKCVAKGEKINFNKHTMHVEVKAVTYSGLKIWEENNKKFIRVIVDI